MTNSIIILIFILYGCANPQPPGGGPPDKSPPLITEYFPENQTTNFSQRIIKLRFNKYMDKSKVVENFSISPNIPVQFDWSGKVLEIELPDQLDTTVTYSINLGTEYSDLLQNKPESAFSLIFSAGSKIDSGYISGKLYSQNPQGTYIFCYSLDKINPDTINPITTKPDYRVQIGSSGEFRISALKDAIYRIFAIKDQFKNFLYDPVDDYGSAISNIQVSKSKSEPAVLKIGSPIDKSGPSLNEAFPEYANHIILKFSEPIDSNYISNEAFELHSIDKSESAKVISSWFNLDNRSKINLIIDKSLDTSKLWSIKCVSNKDFGIRDTLGNLIIDSMNTSKFKPIKDLDSSVINLVYVPVKDSSEYIKVNKIFDFVFDKGIDTSGSIIDVDLYYADTKEKVKFSKEIKGNKISLIPDKELLDNKWFVLNCNIEKIRSYNNIKTIDTNISATFKTVDFKARGNISGIVQINDDICEYDKYLILKHKNGRDIYKVKLNLKYEWAFKNIETGEYIAELFCDIDGNQNYSYGQPYPYTFAEPFIEFNDNLIVKPRWTLENVVLKVKELHAH